MDGMIISASCDDDFIAKNIFFKRPVSDHYTVIYRTATGLCVLQFAHKSQADIFLWQVVLFIHLDFSGVSCVTDVYILQLDGILLAVVKQQ